MDLRKLGWPMAQGLANGAGLGGAGWFCMWGTAMAFGGAGHWHGAMKGMDHIALLGLVETDACACNGQNFVSNAEVVAGRQKESPGFGDGIAKPSTLPSEFDLQSNISPRHEVM